MLAYQKWRFSKQLTLGFLLANCATNRTSPSPSAEPASSLTAFHTCHGLHVLWAWSLCFFSQALTSPKRSKVASDSRGFVSSGHVGSQANVGKRDVRIPSSSFCGVACAVSRCDSSSNTSIWPFPPCWAWYSTPCRKPQPSLSKPRSRVSFKLLQGQDMEGDGPLKRPPKQLTERNSLDSRLSTLDNNQSEYILKKKLHCRHAEPILPTS